MQIFQFTSTFRYTVFVEGIVSAAFTEFTLPNLDVETLDIKEGGQNTYVHKLPVRVSAGNLTLRQGLTRNSQLLSWYLQILKGDLTHAMRQVTVVMYDTTFVPSMIWNFREAYPVKWSGPTLKSSESAVAIEAVEFVHHGFEVV